MLKLSLVLNFDINSILALKWKTLHYASFFFIF